MLERSCRSWFAGPAGWAGWKAWGLLSLALLVSPGWSQAAVPELTTYQGLLTDANGQPVNGTVDLRFTLYTVFLRGVPPRPTPVAVWTETHGDVAVVDGTFSVVLGSIAPLPPGKLASGPFGPPELEVEVNGEALLPRQPLTATPLAIRAALAENVADGSITARKIGEPCGLDEVLVRTASGWACGTAPQGPQGEPGPAGADGADGADGAQGPPGLACWDLNGNGLCERLEDVNRDFSCTALDCRGPQGPQGKPGNLALAGQSCPNGRAVIGFDASGDLVCTEGGCPQGETNCGGFCTDLRFDQNNCGSCGLACVPGQFCRQGACQPFPSILDNTARLEIVGVMDDQVLVTGGPGITIERIPGFRGSGQPDDSSGPNQEHDFVFEYAGSFTGALQTLHDNFLSLGEVRSMSLIIVDLAGLEVFRWNLFEFGLAAIEPGSDGRNRYVFQQTHLPDNLVWIQRDPVLFPQNMSNNPATDTPVEISGIIVNVYPVVEDDPVNRTLTMTFDYTEGGGIFQWVWNVAIHGTSGFGKKSLSVIEESSPGVEIGRTNYFECFPIRYEQFTGFGQPEKVKERVVLSYDWSEQG